MTALAISMLTIVGNQCIAHTLELSAGCLEAQRFFGTGDKYKKTYLIATSGNFLIINGHGKTRNTFSV